MSCVDLPAPSPPGCDRPRPAHKRCPQAGGQRHTAAPERDGKHANLLRNSRVREKTKQEWKKCFDVFK